MIIFLILIHILNCSFKIHAIPICFEFMTVFYICRKYDICMEAFSAQGVSLLNLVLTVTVFSVYKRSKVTDKLEKKSIVLSTTSPILRTASSKNN